MMMDVPPVLQERVVCSILASVKYEVPANIVLAIAEKEGGTPNARVKNRNGSYDVGPMQFNTRYLQDLKKYGIRASDVAQPGCYSYDLAAWRLRQHLRHDQHDLWTRAANYHSRTPKYNRMYRADLIQKAEQWGHWLEARFPTYAITSPGTAPLRVVQTTTDAVASYSKPKAQAFLAHQHAIRALDAFYTKNPMRGVV
ncbi:TPA: transglycosylase SLT domain-containing protein [Legionella pneumophila]